MPCLYQGFAAAATDVLTLLGMLLAIIFNTISLKFSPSDERGTEGPFDVYNALETAEIRAFLPHKQNLATSDFGVFQVLNWLGQA